MSKAITERYIEFTFDDNWEIEKYDDHEDARPFIGVIPNRKAVDFVGHYEGVAYLIEIKDFRGNRIANKPKLSGDLQKAIAAKVYDTLAGLVLANNRSPTTASWRRALGEFTKTGGRVKVVLWLEDDALFGARGPRGKVAASVFLKGLKERLRWMPAHVFVVNRAHNHGALPGVIARDLPGASGHGILRPTSGS